MVKKLTQEEQERRRKQEAEKLSAGFYTGGNPSSVDQSRLPLNERPDLTPDAAHEDIKLFRKKLLEKRRQEEMKRNEERIRQLTPEFNKRTGTATTPGSSQVKGETQITKESERDNYLRRLRGLERKAEERAKLDANIEASLQRNAEMTRPKRKTPTTHGTPFSMTSISGMYGNPGMYDEPTKETRELRNKARIQALRRGIEKNTRELDKLVTKENPTETDKTTIETLRGKIKHNEDGIEVLLES